MDDLSAPPPRHRRRPEPGQDGPPPDPAAGTTPEPDDAAPDAGQRVDLTGLSVAGITRRRVGWAAAGPRRGLDRRAVRPSGRRCPGGLQLRPLSSPPTTPRSSDEVDSLQNELELIVRPQYVGLEARAHRFGSPREIPFTLDPSVPAPVDGAPGSASVRLGAANDRQTPLDSWLSLLFGPTD